MSGHRLSTNRKQVETYGLLLFQQMSLVHRSSGNSSLVEHHLWYWIRVILLAQDSVADYLWFGSAHPAVQKYPGLIQYLELVFPGRVRCPELVQYHELVQKAGLMRYHELVRKTGLVWFPGLEWCPGPARCPCRVQNYRVIQLPRL